MDLRALFGALTFLVVYGRAQRGYYKAAVVEYSPYEGETTPDNILRRNVLEYVEFIKQAAQQGSNIIVFPEDGITGIKASNLPVNSLKSYAVRVQENTLPCTQKVEHPTYYILKNISCAARDNNIYVAVNLMEQEEANSTTTLYNTNVVFDTTGTIIAKSRKINLYYEHAFTPGKLPTTFKTDFNVTFGIFTCFDILFKNPALDILSNNEVTDIIYPSAWFSETPHLSSLTTQAGYARANGVNLLSSGYNRPQGKNGGSGIFLANGSFEAYISAETSSKLIVKDVPILSQRTPPNDCSQQKPLPSAEEATAALDNFSTYKENLANYTLVPLEELETKGKVVCSGKKFCCTFDVTAKEARKANNYFYKLAVYDGVRHAGPLYAGIRSCGIMACVTNDRSTCADRASHLKPASFTSIKISSVVPISDNTFYFPITLQTSLKPLSSYFYCNERINGDKSKIHMETVSEQENLLSFGFYGRVYNRDYHVQSNVAGGKLSGDDWMKIFMAAAAALIVASVLFIFYAQKTDLKLKIT